MDRRNFFRTMIGGVATAAAVRTWPFRSYFFPSSLGKELDLGFNVFDYAGLPMIEDPFIKSGCVYMLNRELIVANPLWYRRLINLEVPKDFIGAE